MQHKAQIWVISITIGNTIPVSIIYNIKSCYYTYSSSNDLNIQFLSIKGPNWTFRLVGKGIKARGARRSRRIEYGIHRPEKQVIWGPTG